MAKLVQIRSPFFIKVDNTGFTSRTLVRAFADMKVWPVGAAEPTLAQFELQKDVVGNTPYVVFEIAELARDYIDIQYNGTTQLTTPVHIEVSVTRVFSSGDNAINLYEYFGLDGYEPFEGGMKSEDGVTAPPANGTYLGSGPTIGGLIRLQGMEGESTTYPTWQAGNVTYNVIAPNASAPSGYRLERDVRIDKRTPIKITFANKNGVLQELWASRKSNYGIEVNNDSYYQNLADFDTMTYNTQRHSMLKYNVIGTRNITVNTSLLPQHFNDIIQDMYLSEQIWITDTSSNTTFPVILKDKSLKYKQHVNDTLVQYTFNFDYANRIDNTIR